VRLRSQIVVLILSLLATPAFGQPAAAQDTRVIPYGNLYLRFSRDGSLLRVIGLSPGDANTRQHVRAVTYAAKTGTVVHVVNLPADTNVLSVTSDGATAVVSTDASSQDAHLFLLNTATATLQAIPESWYQPGSDPYAELSGDGRLVSTYTEDESDTPMTVTVYDWPSKTVVATRKSAFVAAGGWVGGGVTEDGEVEFEGNRVGSTIDDLKTGRDMAKFGPSAVRSPNGQWEVEFPNWTWIESGSTDVFVEGRHERIDGRQARRAYSGQGSESLRQYHWSFLWRQRTLHHGQRRTASRLNTLPSGKAAPNDSRADLERRKLRRFLYPGRRLLGGWYARGHSQRHAAHLSHAQVRERRRGRLAYCFGCVAAASCTGRAFTVSAPPLRKTRSAGFD